MADALDTDADYGQVVRLHRDSLPPVDILDEASIASAAAMVAGAHGPLHMVIVATGILHSAAKGPEKSLRELDPD